MKDHIDLYYGDEIRVCGQGYVPYRWQFSGEDVCILSEKADKINYFRCINIGNQCGFKTTENNINSEFVWGIFPLELRN